LGILTEKYFLSINPLIVFASDMVIDSELSRSSFQPHNIISSRQCHVSVIAVSSHIMLSVRFHGHQVTGLVSQSTDSEYSILAKALARGESLQRAWIYAHPSGILDSFPCARHNIAMT